MEHKYESDLTKKEKRQRELEKLKTMTFLQKLDYLWSYYKVLFALPVILLLVFYLGTTMYHGMKENVVLSVAIVGAGMDGQQIEELETGIKEYLGADGKYDRVRVQANLPEDQESVSGKVSLTTLVGASAIDVLVCPKEVYEEYKGQGGFTGEVQQYRATEGARELFGTAYEEVYVGVLSNAKQKENGAAFCKYVEEKITEYSENNNY